MKIDPNQLVGGAVAPELHGETEHGDRCSVTAAAVGGIPLRWDAMVRLAAGAMAAGDISSKAEDIDRQCEWVARVVDRLIAAHNATAGEVADAQ